MKPMIVIALCVVLVACGGGSAQPTADDVHRQFVEALRTNDRATIDVLTDQAGKRALSETFLGTIQRQVNNEMDPSYDGGSGAFQGIEVRPLTDRGVGKRGISLWRSTDKVRCWVVELAEFDTGWKIVQINSTNDPVECPDA